MLLLLATACSLPSPADAADTTDTADTAADTATDTADTDSADPFDGPCDAVTGTASVFLVSRADPTVLVRPAGAPAEGDRAWALAGPDAHDRYFLVDGDRLLRSVDDGCVWLDVGPADGIEHLYTAPNTDVLYAYRPESLRATTDGVTWNTLSAPLLRAPATLVIDPSDADVLRGYGPDGLLTSRDGGASWLPTPVPTGEDWANVAIDAADIDRVAVVDRDLWVTTNGRDYTAYANGLDAAVTWDDGVLYALTTVYDGDGVASKALTRSDDLGATFVDVPIGLGEEPGIDTFAARGGVVVSVGYWYGGPDGSQGLIVVTDAAGSTVHRIDGYESGTGLAWADDRVIVAVTPPGVETDD